MRLRRFLPAIERTSLVLTLSAGLIAAGLVSPPDGDGLHRALADTASGQDGATHTTKQRDLTRFVDPFVGTEGDHGNDLPGAQAPNGLAKVNPMTMPGKGHSGYDHSQFHIAGFTNTNLDGVGGSGGGGDLLVVPTSVSYTKRPNPDSYSHPFSHDDEDATPGYYRVGLGALKGEDGKVGAAKGTIDSEVSATTRTAMHHYTFPKGQTPQVVFDLNNNFTSRTASSLKTTRLKDGRVSLSGTFAGNFNGAKYAMSYYAITEQKVASVRTWEDSEDLTKATSAKGKDTGAVIGLDPNKGKNLNLRATVSPVSAAQAKKDQNAEVGAKTFEQVKAGIKEEWNRRLGKVDINASKASDPDGKLERLFYTHLYRMFALPVNATSTSGTYKGVDGAVHHIDGYTYYDGWSSWDDFRKYSVFAYVDPEMYRGMIQSLISRFADQAATGDSDPFTNTQSVPNVRWERTAVIIADALSKGYKGFSRLDEAYPAVKDLVGYYSGQELRQGYVTDKPGNGVQRGYDQWALAVIADNLGKTSEAKELRTQAELPIKNQYKKNAWTADDGTEVGLLTPRNADGDFTDVDHEKFEAANLYQGTLWQYNFYGAYDMAGIIKSMGGTKAARKGLEHMFGEDDPDNGNAMLHSNANEIDLQAPYLFNYVGEPSLTQKWARSIYTEPTWNRYIATGQTDGNNPSSANGEFTPPVKTNVYKLEPTGLLPTMDNDAGTMSTMFVASALGVFPVTAGSSQYQLGSPFFDSARIDYGNGRSFTIKADNVSSDSYYVQDARLNGKKQKNTWLDYSDIVGGGTLEATMGSRPSTWGTDSDPAYSLSNASTPGEEHVVTASPRQISADAHGRLDSTVELNLPKAVRLKPKKGTDLLSGRLATLHSVPDGVRSTAVVGDDHSVKLTLRGKLIKNTGIWLEFKDKALADGVGADSLTGTGVTSDDPIRLTLATSDRADLQRLVGSASLVREAHYSKDSYAAFTAALDRARQRLADESASSESLRAAREFLQTAADGLAVDGGGFRVLQGEESDDWSGGDLKNETNESDGNLGGVTDGSWVRYTDLDFTGDEPSALTIRYSNKLAAGTKGSAVSVRAGDKDGPEIATAQLPGTGGWATWKTAEAKVSKPKELADAGSVTLVFSAPESQQWVANIDWLQFSDTTAGGQPADTGDLAKAVNRATPYVAILDRFVPIDVKVFKRELAASRSLLQDKAATQKQVDAQKRALLLATAQLIPENRRQVENAVEEAKSLKHLRYTDASWAKLQAAVDAGTVALRDPHASAPKLNRARSALEEAVNGLKLRPDSVPSVPTKVTSKRDGTGIVVHWNKPKDNGGSRVTGYRVVLSGGRKVDVTDPHERSATFSWLNPGKSYKATVAATNKIGISEASTPTEAIKIKGTKQTSPRTLKSLETETAGPYPKKVLDADYPSDSWPDGKQSVIDMLSGFDKLPKSVKGANKKVKGDPTAHNDKQVVKINNAASTADVDRAQLDADNGAQDRVVDGLGSHLSTVYEAAMKDGDLPKTKAILARVEEKIDGADAVKPVWQYDRPYLRMGLASEGGLIRDNKAGGYDGLAGSGSFPSGHTYHGYIAGTTLATLLPEVGPQMLARASEYGNNRLVLGFHYPLDVMGSRMLGEAVVAHRWADPKFADLLTQARSELQSELTERCKAEGYGSTIEKCEGDHYDGLDDAEAVKVYSERMDYGFPRQGKSGQALITPDDASALLSTRFPDLTAGQRNQILEQTASGAGRALDLTFAGKPSWERINLAKAMNADYVIGGDGKLKVTNYSDQTADSVDTLSRIEVAHTAIDGFDADTSTYVVDWPEGTKAPDVRGVPSASGATTKVTSTGKRSEKRITVTSADSEEKKTYRVLLHRTADDHVPAGTR